MADDSKCPVPHSRGRTNRDWWPNQVNVSVLHQNTPDSDPMGADFDYAKAFQSLDLDAVVKDLTALMTDSQDWWPADYGHYGPFFIRMAWHAAGTYRTGDGRGGGGRGQQRFAPLNSWPDNGNLDKARRLLWPIKQKYGAKLSWADLLILTGNVAIESMGGPVFGFGGGRADVFEPERDIYWGSENQWVNEGVQTRIDPTKGMDDIEGPLAAIQMGLIYVNPEGPNGNPDPLAAAHDIRDTFARMGMNDEETVALIAGGHTFGKAHGAYAPKDCVGVEPAAAGVEQQGTGWQNTCGTGKGADTVTSGLEGAWTSAPVSWTHQYFANLYNFEWEKTKSPAGATQWKPKDGGGEGTVPDAHDASKRHAPMMFTTDLSLREDPAYAAISKRFLENQPEFEQAFADAWFKLTHRDLGPRARYLGPEVPDRDFLWQDPLPELNHPVISEADAARLKAEILASGLSVSELVRVAWASASTYRGTDMRGGANGARIRLAPQASWEVNNPAEVAKVVKELERIQAAFNGAASGGKAVSLADLIVLSGAAAVEQAAGKGSKVPFVPGRVDATADQTDPVSFAFLEPKADGFRNFYTDAALRRPAAELIEKADLLGLTVPEMTALLGGLRVLDANHGGSKLGVFTDQPGVLSNDFFVNLLDLSTTWAPKGDGTFEGKGPDGAVRWTATEVDLVFGSNSELRAICEVYAYDPARFQADFIAAWTKVMQADRFDLAR